jgi:predicted nuclease of predicted toxin-antitoxin system
MKFLLDMGLARSTALFLRQHGYEAVHLREQGLQRLSDEAIIVKAIQENRIILTHDLDFGRIVALSHRQYPSVITFRLDNMQPVQVNH